MITVLSVPSALAPVGVAPGPWCQTNAPRLSGGTNRSRPPSILGNALHFLVGPNDDPEPWRSESRRASFETRLPASRGGELVLAQIDAALLARGHRSLIVAPRGSCVRGSLISTGALPGVLDDDARRAARARTRQAIMDAVRDCEVDVVHLHGPDFAEVMPPVDVPALVTLHLPITHYLPSILRQWANLAAFGCVSSTQAAELPDALRDRVAVIDTGVDLARYRPRVVGKSRYVLALDPEPSWVVALDAARRARRPLVLAGPLDPSCVGHFEAEIAPRLGRGVRFVGEVSGPRRRRLLAGAHCLLVPSRLAAPSARVAIEALASGTPVVALRSSGLGAVLEEGRTGFLVDDAGSMADAIERVGAIDRRACRAAAERRFDLRRTTSRWVALLEALACRPMHRVRSEGG